MGKVRKVQSRQGVLPNTLDQILLSVLALRLQVAAMTLEQLKPQVAEAVVVVPLEPDISNRDAVASPDLPSYAVKVAEEHGLDVKRFTETIACESQWNPAAVGDHGTSFGLAQLHYPVEYWGVTPEEAKDPAVALPIMAKAWQRGEQWKWSCYKNKYL